MNIYESFSQKDFVNTKSEIACLGAFDGVHLGHQKLIEETQKIDTNFQLITFDIVPKKYFNSQHQLITNNKTKTKMISKYKPENLIYLKFNEFKNMEKNEFCNFLQKNCKIKKILIGKDFRFGKNRDGGIKDLENIFGYDNVIVLDDVFHNGIKVSSTKIKEFLANGLIEEANELLGYKYNFDADVIEGQKLGSKIGFPTANLNIQPSEIILKNGVYFVTVTINDKQFKGAMNIGFKPTIDTNSIKTIEVHILDFDSNIYNQYLNVEVIKYLREEQKFDSVNDLTKQINLDIKQIKNY